LTVIDRPFNSLPFKPLMAASPASFVDISTKPKPFDLPLNLSMIMLTESTWPNSPKACRKSSS
jgi:hypothetical protein